MTYLENAFKFTFKNILIAIPLLIAAAIPSMVMGIGNIGFLSNMGNFQKILRNIMEGGQYNFGPELFTSLYGPTMLASMGIATLLVLIFSILVYPATYGMINKKYETGNSGLNDFSSCMSKYIGRFVLYGLLKFAIGIGLVLVLGILIGISVVIITMVSNVAGIILMVLFILGFIVGSIALGTYMSLWFPAICIENSNTTTGLKNSFRYVSGSFWPILGITLLVSLCGGAASLILSTAAGWVPIIGSAVSSVVTALAEFITIVFYFEIYRAKSGKFASQEYYRELNGQN